MQNAPRLGGVREAMV